MSLVKNNYMDEGFAISVQPNPIVPVGKWILIAPGYHSSVSMTLHATSISQSAFSLSSPPCDTNRQLSTTDGDHFSTNFNSLTDLLYSRDSCNINCVAQFFAKRCHCLPMFENPHIRTCELWEFYECAGNL